MAIQGCRNAIEELVVEEVKVQVSRLASGVRTHTSVDDIAAYALNRLPPLYATTRRGYLQQQKKAFTELKQEISQTISRGLIGVRKDSLKDATPLPEEELEREERSLVKLQEFFSDPNLRWRDLPKKVETGMMDLKIKGAVAYSNYKSKALHSANDVANYLKRHEEAIKWKPRSSTPNLQNSMEELTELKEFASYLAPATWQFINTLENLVAAVADRQISKLEPDIQPKVTLEEVCAYALNRLPPMYATTDNGLKYWRERARVELAGDILATVRQSIIIIAKSPSRFLPPLRSDKFSNEQEQAIAELKDILQIDDINWRNVVSIIQDAFEQVQNGEIIWVPRDRRYFVQKAQNS